VPTVSAHPDGEQGGRQRLLAPFPETDDAPLNTNPEELIGAGLAGCFAMSVANLLEQGGYGGVE